jgi:GTP-binding protein
MKISSSRFVISAVGPGQYPADGLPEIALVGRSNVGKSSLINRMLLRRNLARTSNTPGRTQTMNYYRVNESFYFVDLPGYGYAKVSKAMKARWGKMIEQYLKERETLTLVIQVVDVRHPPTQDDIDMAEWLAFIGRPAVVAVTKTDKIAKGKLPKHLKVVEESLRNGNALKMIPFSAETGLGRDALWECITPYIRRQTGAITEGRD